MAKLLHQNKLGSTIGTEYAEHLKREHDGGKWGSTGPKYAGHEILRLLSKRDYIRTVLDFGAGKAKLKEYVVQQGWNGEWTNYDPGMPEYDVLPDKQFDLVLTSDVMEHIEPHLLKEVLKTLADRTFKILYNNISCVETGKLFGQGPYIGQDMHLIVEPPKWWREQFKRHCPLTEFYYMHEEYPQRGRHTVRCTMIHERT